MPPAHHGLKGAVWQEHPGYEAPDFTVPAA